METNMLQPSGELPSDQTPDQKEKFYLGAAAVLVLVMLVAVPLAVFPLRGKLDDAKSLRDDVLGKKAGVQQQLTVLHDAETALSGVSEVKQSEYLDAIPDGVQQDTLIKNLNDLATKYGVVLSGVQFGLSDTQELPKRVNMSASFQSGYSDLLEFLRAIEANRRRIHVKTISVQVIPQASTSAVNFSLEMEAFYQGK